MSERDLDTVLRDLKSDQPVLIAGPTASGKSALALKIAAEQGGLIVNADAIQIYENWRILSARPSESEESLAPHVLYGHVARDVSYSVGHWLRDVRPHLGMDERPIIVGGTGLYFTALTEGLAEIPPTPADIRALADTREFAELLADLDRFDTLISERIDRQNRARVQRAWEVYMATGTPLSDWQNRTPAPLLPAEHAHCIVLEADRDWLSERIERRFDHMLDTGALEEARTNLQRWSDDLPAAKCIGARELVAYVRGEINLEHARNASIIATRQYAKRQRTWFRARMRDWIHLDCARL